VELSRETLDALLREHEERLKRAAARMFSATSAEAFLAAEKENQRIALEGADALTSTVLQQMVKDPVRAERSLSDVRKRAGAKNITVISRGLRSTEVQLLGGSRIHVTSPYLCAVPAGDRPQIHRGAAGTGVYPVLDELGICDRSTPALRLRVAHAVTEANSVTDARELMRQSGLSVSHGVALRLSYAVGSTVVMAREKLSARPSPEVVDDLFAGRHVVLCLDGGRVRTRRAVAGRPRTGGRKHFVRDWREPKVLTLYTTGENGRRDKTFRSVIDATLGGADAVFRLARYHLRRLGGARAASLTVVGDGALWIWKRASKLKKDLGLGSESYTEVVDYFHAVERLFEFAHGRPGWSEARATLWAKQQKQRLKQGWADRIATSMRKLLTAEERSSEDDPAGYFERNADRMKYSDFRAAGLPCGSGAVESAVRRVVNMRMKSASVVWTNEHAEEMLVLRSHSKAGRWDEIEDLVCRWSRWNPARRRPARRSQPNRHQGERNADSQPP
jgi:hypothetical protein